MFYLQIFYPVFCMFRFSALSMPRKLVSFASLMLIGIRLCSRISRSMSINTYTTGAEPPHKIVFHQFGDTLYQFTECICSFSQSRSDTCVITRISAVTSCFNPQSVISQSLISQQNADEFALYQLGYRFLSARHCCYQLNLVAVSGTESLTIGAQKPS